MFSVTDRERPRAIRRGRVGRGGIALALAGALAGCGSLLDASLPAGTVDPASFRNRDGALQRYHEVVSLAPAALVQQAISGGTLSDELMDNDLGGFGITAHPLDERLLPEYATAGFGVPTDALYSQLHALRGNAEDAVGMLRKYAPDAPRAYLGETYALMAYAEIGLADEYCSGVPLSTLDFEEDFTYKAGSSTAAVYEQALAHLDTALAFSTDSALILNLARVGRGRTLLALGRFADAAAAVADVPDGFQYQFPVLWRDLTVSNGNRVSPFARVTVADTEGRNGLPYISSGDPRTAAIDTGANHFGLPVYVPVKYQNVAPYVVADWIEARLITAEAKLKAGDAAGWLGDLNALREAAITPALADTTDPGTEQGRVDLTFRERAMWLFITGHRHGDLRRLMRQYGRRQEDALPVGAYPGGPGAYGSDVTIPIPPQERLNPLFTGCINRLP